MKWTQPRPRGAPPLTSPAVARAWMGSDLRAGEGTSTYVYCRILSTYVLSSVGSPGRWGGMRGSFSALSCSVNHFKALGTRVLALSHSCSLFLFFSSLLFSFSPFHPSSSPCLPLWVVYYSTGEHLKSPFSFLLDHSTCPILIILLLLHSPTLFHIISWPTLLTVVS